MKKISIVLFLFCLFLEKNLKGSTDKKKSLKTIYYKIYGKINDFVSKDRLSKKRYCNLDTIRKQYKNQIVSLSQFNNLVKKNDINQICHSFKNISEQSFMLLHQKYMLDFHLNGNDNQFKDIKTKEDFENHINNNSEEYDYYDIMTYIEDLYLVQTKTKKFKQKFKNFEQNKPVKTLEYYASKYKEVTDKPFGQLVLWGIFFGSFIGDRILKEDETKILKEQIKTLGDEQIESNKKINTLQEKQKQLKKDIEEVCKKNNILQSQIKFIQKENKNGLFLAKNIFLKKLGKIKQ